MTTSNKRLLFLRATTTYNQTVVGHIVSICELLSIEIVEYSFTSLEDFKSYGSTCGKFDYLYIAAHGNHTCFGETSPLNTVRWADFGVALCDMQIMNEGSVLFMGCCHGGLKRVALILFCNCPSITSVCGPRWKISTHEVAVALHVFLYNLLIAHEEPISAAEKVSSAVGYGFPIYDRYDLEAEIAILQNYCWVAGGDYTPTSDSPDQEDVE